MTRVLKTDDRDGYALTVLGPTLTTTPPDPVTNPPAVTWSGLANGRLGIHSTQRSTIGAHISRKGQLATP